MVAFFAYFSWLGMQLRSWYTRGRGSGQHQLCGRTRELRRVSSSARCVASSWLATIAACVGL